MRLVVDNWILTTIKQNDQQAKSKCLTIDQHVEQEQNLFDSSNDLDLSLHSSSKSLNQIALNEEKMQNDVDMIKDFTSFLYNQLDIESFGIVETHIDQLSNIMRHLDNEHQLLANELNEQFFSHQDQIVKYVQDTLRIKNLLMCQSVPVLEQARTSIYQAIESKLDNVCLNKAERMLSQIEKANASNVDRIKTMIKLKINRLQNYVNIWNELEDVCANLENIFVKYSQPFHCSIQYRSVSIEINNYINRLKEKLNTLTCVLSEAKYFEFKNLIVIYEIKFKKLKELNETNCATPEALVPSSARHIVRKTQHIQQQQQQQTIAETPVCTKRDASIPLNYEFRQKTSLTCDKSTFTVCHESTQTESIYDSVMQSDGKKFLLEAYLSNNDNLASCSTSSKKNKSESGTGLMRESGIGTANDDDSLPLTDGEKQCADDEEKLNLSVETYPIENKKKYSRKKANKLKSMSNLSTWSTSSSSKTESNLYKRKNNKKQSTKQLSQALNQQTSNQSILKFLLQKLIKFFIIFLIPILFILLFLAYVLYRNYLNPYCCDMKRNYLLINVT